MNISLFSARETCKANKLTKIPILFHHNEEVIEPIFSQLCFCENRLICVETKSDLSSGKLCWSNGNENGTLYLY